MSRIAKDSFDDKVSLEPTLDDTFPRTQSQEPAALKLPTTLRRADEAELGRERHHDCQGHAPNAQGTNAPSTYRTYRQQQREQEGGEKETQLSSSTLLLSGSPSRQSERAITKHDGHRRQQGARKSLVDRQSKSLGWSAGTPTMASNERERRASDVSSHRPWRRDSSRRDSRSSSGEAHRRSVSAAAAAMPRSSSSSGAGFFGSFDDSRYWDFAFRFTQRQDIGNQCRECKRPFLVLDEEIAVRR